MAPLAHHLEDLPDGTLTLWSGPVPTPAVQAQSRRTDDRIWHSSIAVGVILAALSWNVLDYSLECSTEQGGCTAHRLSHDERIPTSALGPATVQRHRGRYSCSYALAIPGLFGDKLAFSPTQAEAQAAADRFNAFREGSDASFSTSSSTGGIPLQLLMVPIVLGGLILNVRRALASRGRTPLVRLTPQDAAFRPLPPLRTGLGAIPDRDAGSRPRRRRLPLEESAFFELKPTPNPGVTVLQLVSFGGEAFELLEGAPSDLEPLRDTFAQRLELLRARLGSA